MELSIFLPRLAYVEIDSLIFFPTLFLSLLNLVKRDYKSLVKSIGIVGPLFLVWDVFATVYNTWSFNPEWVLGVKIFHLPIEEILFFVVTPFATLLIYDYVMAKLRDKEIRWISRRLIVAIALLLLLIDFLLTSYSYTFVLLIYTSFSILLAEFLDPYMLRSRNYWIFIGLSYIPFFVFDYFLTSIPVVVYGTHSILGVRILTIPIEDAIYSFSMINLYTLFYRRGVKLWNMKR